jgi:hypothetical protein
VSDQYCLVGSGIETLRILFFFFIFETAISYHRQHLVKLVVPMPTLAGLPQIRPAKVSGVPAIIDRTFWESPANVSGGTLTCEVLAVEGGRERSDTYGFSLAAKM